MKRFLTITVIAMSLIVFTACGSNKKDKDNTDTGDDTDVVDTDTTDTTPSGDTTPEGDTDADTAHEGDTDTNTDTSDTEAPSSNCTGISVDWDTFSQYEYSNQFVATNDDYDPVVMVSFFQDLDTGAITAGTYDLAKGANANYKDCTECVLVYADYDEEEGYAKMYYQKSGTLKVEAVDDSNNIKGSINAVLVEVTIDENDYTSTPVANGSCVEIETATFDSGYEEACVPQCDGKECGEDGCGGFCGFCDDGEGCNANSECVPFELPETCESADIKWDSFTNYYGDYYTEGDPYIYMELMGDLAATDYDLGLENNYADCDECIRIYKDDKTFFQYSGHLVINAFDSNDNISGSLNAVFVESHIGGYDYDYQSTPVAGGTCIKVEEATFDSGVCIPNCEGKSCGDDGCGGHCGICGEGEGCNADFECAAFEMPETCTGLSVAWDALYQSNLNVFYASGATETDPVAKMAFYQNEDTGEVSAGTYDLGSDKNKEYASCTECVFAYSDVVDDVYSKTYFQHEGTLVISSVGENNNIAGTISAKLVETFISYDEETESIITTPIVGGACFEVESAAFAVAE